MHVSAATLIIIHWRFILDESNIYQCDQNTYMLTVFYHLYREMKKQKDGPCTLLRTFGCAQQEQG